jgi:ectoine hydroxylase-related dioxygenase (phytanoyl-CoA dioxygenase family)
VSSQTAEHVSQSNIADAYDSEGFAFPLDILSAAEAQALRNDLETAEAELKDAPEKLALLSSYPDRLLPSFDALIRHPKLLEAAAAVLGPDLMVWSASIFTKEANSPNIVSWHQDLTYWDLDDAEEVTGWVALSPATRASGCMQFIAGSHKQRAVPHVDTFDENNLLSRGQELAVDVNQEDAVYVELQPGQASLHHGHLFHASDPNTTDDRRIASAIRYIRPSMKQSSGEKTLVAQVAGEDRHGNFVVAGPPQGRLHEDDFVRCRHDSQIKRRLLYAGAEDKAGQGKRYK